VGVQREIAKNTKVEVSVIGSHSYHLQSGFLAGKPAQPADFQALIARGGPGALWPWVSDPASAAACRVCPIPTLVLPGTLDGYLLLTRKLQRLGDRSLLSAIRSATPTTKPCRSASPSAPVHGLAFRVAMLLSATHGNTDTPSKSFGDGFDSEPLRSAAGAQWKSLRLTPLTSSRGMSSYDLPLAATGLLLSHANSVVDAVAGGWILNFGYHLL